MHVTGSRASSPFIWVGFVNTNSETLVDSFVKLDLSLEESSCLEEVTESSSASYVTALSKSQELMEALDTDLYQHKFSLKGAERASLLMNIKGLLQAQQANGSRMEDPSEAISKEIKYAYYRPQSNTGSPHYFITAEKIYKLFTADRIGFGGFSSVYKIKSLAPFLAPPLAIKMIKSDEPSSQKKESAYIKNEYLILKHIHESAKQQSGALAAGIMGPVHLLTVFNEKKRECHSYLAPLYDRVCYSEFLIEKQRFDGQIENDKLFQAAQLLAALYHLNKSQVVHGDIKVDNIFLLKGKLIRLFLGDFGGAALEAKVACNLTYCHSKKYILHQDFLAIKSLVEDESQTMEEKRPLYVELRRAMDCFAMGVVLFFLFAKKDNYSFPYPSTSNDFQYYSSSLDIELLQTKFSAPQPLKNIVTHLLNPKYQERMKAQEAFETFKNWLHAQADKNLVAMIQEEEALSYCFNMIEPFKESKCFL